jgi:hypothetical protein
MSQPPSGTALRNRPTGPDTTTCLDHCRMASSEPALNLAWRDDNELTFRPLVTGIDRAAEDGRAVVARI